MANLIDKSALLAEIERRLNYRVKSLKAINDGTYQKEGQGEGEFNESLARCAFNETKNELFELKCFIDTLETKEVDLDKEIDDYMAKEWEGIEEDKRFYDMIKSNLSDIAKHFYELGLKAQNEGEIVAEEECTCNKILNRIVGKSWNIICPVYKMNVNNGDKVKIRIIKGE